MANRVNRAIELLDQGQPIYYSGAHTGHVLTREQGTKDAAIWSDYINVGMEHGSFDMGGLESYMQGMAEAGPTASGHRTPTVIVEAPVEGTSAEIVRYNAWQFRQILARGVHGILLCQAETPEAVAAFVEACRYPINRIGVGAGLQQGRRGVGSEPSAAAIWGVDYETYLDSADPWPLNPEGELLLGLKIESAAALPRIEEIFAVPGIGFAEMGPGDLSISLGYRRRPPEMPPEMQEASERVQAACQANGVAFLQPASAENITARIDAGVRVFGGHDPELARIGRAYTKRQMPA
jgi:4-hydroxy-2-oxoheptanedioate aldolase